MEFRTEHRWVLPGGRVDERETARPACPGPARRSQVGRASKLPASGGADVRRCGDPRGLQGVHWACSQDHLPAGRWHGRDPSGATSGSVSSNASSLGKHPLARPGARPASRSHRRQGALADTGLRAAPLRHVVLRRSHASPFRSPTGRPPRPTTPTGWSRRGRIGQAPASMLPPTVICIKRSATRASCCSGGRAQRRAGRRRARGRYGPDGAAVEIVERCRAGWGVGGGGAAGAFLRHGGARRPCVPSACCAPTPRR